MGNGWKLCFQWGTYHYGDEEPDEDGFRFIWRRPAGNLQPARGQARIPSETDMFDLLVLANHNGWFTFPPHVHVKMQSINVRTINREKHLLQKLLHQALVETMRTVDGWCRTKGNTPQEPDFVAGLTLEFTPRLYQILKGTFPQSRFSVSGVFCHQKPIVDIGMPKNPELGDLLLVYIQTDRLGRKRHNSLLLQAKLSNDSATRVADTDDHQLRLYEDWPLFKYQRAGKKLNRLERDILPKAPNDGAQYLLIDNDPVLGFSGLPGTFPLGCAAPSKILTIDNDLATELVDLLKFKAGREFEKDPSATRDHWTKMVWEMLEIADQRKTQRANAGLYGMERKTTRDYDGTFCFFSDASSVFSNPGSPTGGKMDGNGFVSDNDGALSVIVIESFENEAAE
jgi:hypothetical protein